MSSPMPPSLPLQLILLCLLAGLLLGPATVLAQGEADETGGDMGMPNPPAEPTPETETRSAEGDSLSQGQSPMEAAQAAQGAQEDRGEGEGVGVGEGEGETPAAPAPPPTGFHPNYSSKFDINRRTNTWTQQLSFNTTVNGVGINNSTSVAIGEDTSLDRDQRQRTSTTSLTYSYNENLKLSGSLGFTRNLTDDSRARTSLSADRFSGKLDYTQALLAGVKGVFAVNAGTQKDKREDPLTSDRESIGPYAESTADFTYAGSAWDWSVNSRYRNSSLESRELNTNTTTQDRNTNADVGFMVNLKLPGLTKFTVNANRAQSSMQQPLRQSEVGAGGQLETVIVQETTDQLNRDFSLDAAASPLKRLDLTARYTFRNNGVDRVFDTERSQESLDRAFSGNLAYEFPDSTKISSRFDWGVARSIYEAESREFLNGDIATHALGGTLARTLGSRTRFDASGSYQLQSYFFDDTETNKDDRDVVRADFAATANYDPTQKIDTMLRFSLQHNQTIYIDRTKSSANTTQQTYTINPSMTYDLTPRVLLREDASVIAIARVFDFDEDRNKLSRNTEFRTSVEADLYSRFDMEMRHVHRTVLDGSYRRDEIDGIRKFGKSSETVTHDLTLRLNYRPLTGSQIYFRLNRRLGDTTARRQLAGEFVDVTTSTESTEIDVGGNINHNLSNGVRLNARMRRVQNWDLNNRRNNFFVGEVTVAYNF